MKPILFNTEMVKAILEGKKTQTRREIKAKAVKIKWQPIVLNGYAGFCDEHGNPVKPKYSIGDILWVRETWQYVDIADDYTGYVYRATGGLDWEMSNDEWKWKPNIFMPKEACRLFLEVTNVRAERLQEITERDAIAEGVQIVAETPIKCYKLLWQKINGAESWEANPFVWVIEFKVIDKPQLP